MPRERAPRFSNKSLPTYQERLRGASGMPRYDATAHPPRAHRMALLGWTNFEMADMFGVSESTFNDWINKHPPFAKAVREGKAEADGRVAEALYKRATGYSHPAVRIFQGTEQSGPIVVPYTEHHPPDTGAARFWLTNRQRHLWKEKQEVEHIGSIEARLRALTPEQRHARLVELQAKVDAHLAYEVATDAEFKDAAPDEAGD